MDSAMSETINTYRVKFQLNCSKDVYAELPVDAKEEVQAEMKKNLWVIENALKVTLIKGNYQYKYCELDSENSTPLYKITFTLATEILVDETSEKKAILVVDDKVKNMLYHFDMTLPFRIENRKEFVQFITKLS